jgi:hypothetical protein
MQYSAPVGKSTRTTWRTTAAEIAAALGIPGDPGCYFVLEDATGDDGGTPLADVDVVRWSPHQAGTYAEELAVPPGR